MVRDKIFLTYVAADVLFVVSGGLLILFSLKTEAELSNTPTVQNLAQILLLRECSQSAGIGNAVLVFLTFLVSIPGMVMPMTRGWLKLSGYMTLVCAVYTMILGLSIWFQTLRTRENLLSVWTGLPASSQSLLQQEFSCCGYMNSTSPPFVPDAVCPNSLIAASTVGCVGPFSTYANNFLDLIFTGAFGIVGIDVILIIATAMLLKDRKEQERYRHIDEKVGVSAF